MLDMLFDDLQIRVLINIDDFIFNESCKLAEEQIKHMQERRNKIESDESEKEGGEWK
jgi:hypothetical protein